MKWLSKRQLGKGTWTLVGLMALALIDGHAVGQCQLDKLLDTDGATNYLFGLPVSISGSVAISNTAFRNGLDTYSRSIMRRTHHVPMR